MGPQIPRLYAVYKEQGIIENFEQMLDNIFVPLFEVTKDPASHPQLHLFLKQARGDGPHPDPNLDHNPNMHQNCKVRPTSSAWMTHRVWCAHYQLPGTSHGMQ